MVLTITRKEGGGKYKSVGLVSKADKEIWFDAECPAGTYIATIEGNWLRSVNELALGVYGPDVISEFKVVPPAEVPETMNTDCALEEARRDTSGMEWYASQGEPKIGFKQQGAHEGLGYLYFKNDSASTTLQVRLQITQCIDCELSKVPS